MLLGRRTERAALGNPEMLLVLARDLLVDRDRDHAKTAAQAELRCHPGNVWDRR